MRRRRKKKSHGSESVELNVTAMLDMAFQLLAFFILTFRPSAAESEISLRMPSVATVTQGASAAVGLQLSAPTQETFLPQLTVKLHGTEGGDIGRVEIGQRAFDATDRIDTTLATVQTVLSETVTEVPYDGVTLYATKNLRYERVIQVIDVCSRTTLPSGEALTKISIQTLEDAP